MGTTSRIWGGILVLGGSLVWACGSSKNAGSDDSAGGSTSVEPITMPGDLPQPGNGQEVELPAAAALVDVSQPTSVVGTGSPESCTSQAFVEAVHKGGIITFSCGAQPYTLELEATAEVNNLGEKEVVIDGGGLITLSGQGKRRILYQNVCLERLGWATSDCWGQGFPRLVLQNLSFINGYTEDKEGGGAVHVSGGRLKLLNTRFFNNHASYAGPDEGGGALRVEQIQEEPVYIVNSTFGGEAELGNSAANGGAISGLFVNYALYNTKLSFNSTTSCCGNPAESGPGGGSGGAIYMDGNLLQLSLVGSSVTDNSCQAHGSGIFFVSNDHKGKLTLKDSSFARNAEGQGNWYPLTDISMHDDTVTVVENTSFED